MSTSILKKHRVDIQSPTVSLMGSTGSTAAQHQINEMSMLFYLRQREKGMGEIQKVESSGVTMAIEAHAIAMGPGYGREPQRGC